MRTWHCQPKLDVHPPPGGVAWSDRMAVWGKTWHCYPKLDVHLPPCGVAWSDRMAVWGKTWHCYPKLDVHLPPGGVAWSDRMAVWGKSTRHFVCQHPTLSVNAPSSLCKFSLRKSVRPIWSKRHANSVRYTILCFCYCLICLILFSHASVVLGCGKLLWKFHKGGGVGVG